MSVVAFSIGKAKRSKKQKYFTLIRGWINKFHTS